MEELTRFKPDWQQTFTVDLAEQELIDFKFQGIGWYVRGDDTILVLPLIFAQRPGDPVYYTFSVWNGGDPRSAMKAVANLKKWT